VFSAEICTSNSAPCFVFVTEGFSFGATGYVGLTSVAYCSQLMVIIVWEFLRRILKLMYFTHFLNLYTAKTRHMVAQGPSSNTGPVHIAAKPWRLINTRHEPTCVFVFVLYRCVQFNNSYTTILL
jgi:hypothetical protein